MQCAIRSLRAREEAGEEEDDAGDDDRASQARERRSSSTSRASSPIRAAPATARCLTGIFARAFIWRSSSVLTQLALLPDWREARSAENACAPATR